jgi:hypothetical protein
MVDLLSQPPTPVLLILEVRCATYDTWKDQYATDLDFREIWGALQTPTVINQTPFLDYTIRDGWLYKLNLLCVPHSKDRLLLIREAHASAYGGHFGTTKTIQHLQHHFHWPSMQRHLEILSKPVHYAHNPSHPIRSMGYINHCLFLLELGSQSQWTSSVDFQQPKSNTMQSGL